MLFPRSIPHYVRRHVAVNAIESPRALPSSLDSLIFRMFFRIPRHTISALCSSSSLRLTIFISRISMGMCIVLQTHRGPCCKHVWFIFFLAPTLTVKFATLPLHKLQLCYAEVATVLRRSCSCPTKQKLMLFVL
jgi:hypothetical protein